ncbi:MAG: S-adenosylmethionine:tRNA ribosyltransferase-isomerase [Lewinellaceae bacterium]|nr:S-adenosylmethionine:tRNA ribosyltransferase-isomerase [Lewinellaceae bacterium]
MDKEKDHMDQANTKPSTPKAIRIEEYEYQLPDARIARFPLEQRDASKLLLYKGGQLGHTGFRELHHHLPEGALYCSTTPKSSTLGCTLSCLMARHWRSSAWNPGAGGIPAELQPQRTSALEMPGRRQPKMERWCSEKGDRYPARESAPGSYPPGPQR